LPGVTSLTRALQIPLTFFVALFSAKNLATILPPLKDALDKHSRAAEVTTSLIPCVCFPPLHLLAPRH
jgi:hypothetical protein